MTSQSKPLVSLVVPVYRNQPYLEPALRSILAQDYENLEIIVRDDASPDDAYEVIKRVANEYDGPHNLKIGKNKQNESVGIFNTFMKMTTADFVVTAHDDDIQYSHRISTYVEAFLKHKVSMVTSNSMRINSNGETLGIDNKRRSGLIKAEQFAKTGWTEHVHGPTLSWHRDVFDRFGPINIDGTARCSDWIIPYRASLLDGIYYLSQATMDRRIHAASRGAIGRTTDDQDIFAVEDNSESATQLVYMLKTTKHAEKLGIISSNRFKSLSTPIRNKILYKVDGMAIARNRLHMKKMRMAWVPHSIGSATPMDFLSLPDVRSRSNDAALQACVELLDNTLAIERTR